MENLPEPPPATSSSAGVVQPDNSTITINSDGIITAISGEAKITLSRINNDSYSLAQCMPVALTSGNNVIRASSSLLLAYPYNGLVSDVSISVGYTGIIQAYGLLTTSTPTWQDLTGESSGLTEGATYYVSNTIGCITKDTSSITSVLQVVGVAMSTTTMLLTNSSPILL